MSKSIITTKASWPIVTIVTIKIDPRLPMTEQRIENIKTAMTIVKAYNHE